VNGAVGTPDLYVDSMPCTIVVSESLLCAE
jgi:hypothetical protein